MRGSTAARFSDPRLDTPRALTLLPGLPLRPATVWAGLKAASDPADLLVSGLPEMNLQGCCLSDPGWLLARVSSGPASSDIQLISERTWWRTRSPEFIRGLDRLARWSGAVAWTMRLRLGLDLSEAKAEEIAQIAWLAPLGLWAMAAVDPQLLPGWLDCRTAESRRGWEEQHLGERLKWLGRNLADRWQVSPAVAAAAWLFTDHTRLGQVGIAAEHRLLLEAWSSACDWVAQTPLALSGPRLLGQVPDPSEIRSWMAGLQAASPTSFMAYEPGEREAVLMRAFARKLAQPSVQVSIRPDWKLVATQIVSRHTLSDVKGMALELEQALLAWPGVRAVRIQDKAIAELRAAGDEAPDLLLPLPDANQPRFWLSVWYSERDPSSEAAPVAADQIEWLKCWARWVRELDQLRALSQTLMDAAGDDLEDTPELLNAMGQFAAGAGHELNNPLAVIMGRAQLLLSRLEDPEAQRSLRIIIGQSQRAHRMLRDLMYYAQPTAARPRSCVPEEVVRRGLEDLRPEADARGVALQFTMPAGVRVAVSSIDPDQLRLTLDALVRNAMEASAPSTAVLVRIQRRGEWLKLEVRDQGRGLRADEGHHLLNPLYSGRQAGRGLGLGLPRLARMLNEIGGTLVWSSRPGGGARFEVQLPLILATTAETKI